MIALPPQVERGLSLLGAAGFEAYVVGGAVRDSLRKKGPVKDWDLTTNARPRQVEEVFSQFPVIETGLKHGTVTVMLDGLPLEITTYRVDGNYTDHRRPDQVRFSRSLEEDVRRRDFTINALAYHPNTGVVDWTGGRKDLEEGRIRCVGDPDRRFQEDGLRILRAIRFASVFGMTLEEETGKAVHRNRDLLRAIAPERIRGELTRLLCGPGVRAVLLEYSDVLSVPIPELAPLVGFDQRNPHHEMDIWGHTAVVAEHSPPDPILRWAALLHDVGKPPCFTLSQDGVGHFYGHPQKGGEMAEAILHRLRFDTAGRTAITQLVRCHDLPVQGGRRAVRRLLCRLGAEPLRRLIALRQADVMGHSQKDRERLREGEEALVLLEDLIAEGACVSRKDLAVDGRDLLALGLQGREIKTALEDCLRGVVEEWVPNQREALLQYVRDRRAGKEPGPS